MTGQQNLVRFVVKIQSTRPMNGVESLFAAIFAGCACCDLFTPKHIIISLRQTQTNHNFYQHSYWNHEARGINRSQKR
jgi:hypothetical protein